MKPISSCLTNNLLSWDAPHNTAGLLPHILVGQQGYGCLSKRLQFPALCYPCQLNQVTKTGHHSLQTYYGPDKLTKE